MSGRGSEKYALVNLLPWRSGVPRLARHRPPISDGWCKDAAEAERTTRPPRPTRSAIWLFRRLARSQWRRSPGALVGYVTEAALAKAGEALQKKLPRQDRAGERVRLLSSVDALLTAARSANRSPDGRHWPSAPFRPCSALPPVRRRPRPARGSASQSAEDCGLSASRCGVNALKSQRSNT